MGKFTFNSYLESAETARHLARTYDVSINIIRDGPFFVIEVSDEIYRWEVEILKDENRYNIDYHNEVERSPELDEIHDEISSDTFLYAQSEDEGWFYDD